MSLHAITILRTEFSYVRHLSICDVTVGYRSVIDGSGDERGDQSLELGHINFELLMILKKE